MSHNSRANPHTETISAGELAEMGLCEKKIHLRQLLEILNAQQARRMSPSSISFLKIFALLLRIFRSDS